MENSWKSGKLFEFTHFTTITGNVEKSFDFTHIPTQKLLLILIKNYLSVSVSLPLLIKSFIK